MSSKSQHTRPVLDRRRAGVLLHPTSLPSGTLGEDAIRFLDFLHKGSFSVWQMLPLGPVGPNGSPYSLDSAFAGNPELIPAHLRHQEVSEQRLAKFRQREVGWLDDYALFTAIHGAEAGRPWWEWPRPLRQRDPSALKTFARQNAAAIRSRELEQCRFDMTWQLIRERADQRGILLYGDLPMFVVADSADVWANPAEFRLDENGIATQVAGVPPDSFTELGQCWDSPVYDWDHMRSNDFAWWKKRLAHECRRFDLLRWDHFRGLSATWEIPVHAGRTAAEGQWNEVPGRELLECLNRELGSLPLVAENLGVITPDVEQLRHDFGLPGMHVLQFAFDGDELNPHLPVNHEVQGIAYTGTHDNNTTLGWFSGLAEEIQKQVLHDLGRPTETMPGALIQEALASDCRLAMIPLQDLLGLGSGARMNVPGQAEGQWRWRFSWADLNSGLANRWRQAVLASGRMGTDKRLSKL